MPWLDAGLRQMAVERGALDCFREKARVSLLRDWLCCWVVDLVFWGCYSSKVLDFTGCLSKTFVGGCVLPCYSFITATSWGRGMCWLWLTGSGLGLGYLTGRDF